MSCDAGKCPLRNAPQPHHGSRRYAINGMGFRGAGQPRVGGNRRSFRAGMQHVRILPGNGAWRPGLCGPLLRNAGLLRVPPGPVRQRLGRLLRAQGLLASDLAQRRHGCLRPLARAVLRGFRHMLLGLRGAGRGSAGAYASPSFAAACRRPGGHAKQSAGGPAASGPRTGCRAGILGVVHALDALSPTIPAAAATGINRRIVFRLTAGTADSLAIDLPGGRDRFVPFQDRDHGGRRIGHHDLFLRASTAPGSRPVLLGVCLGRTVVGGYWSLASRASASALREKNFARPKAACSRALDWS